MAVSEHTHAQIAIAGFADRIARAILGMISTVQMWKDAHRTHKMLSKLSDSELTDIGLTRADIETVARGDYR